MSEQDTQQYLESISVRPEVEIKEPPIHKRAWAVSKTILKNFPKWFGLYLGLCGLWGFSCFIAEEAIQTAIFSVWQSIPCEEWRLVKHSITTMEAARTTMLTINNLGGQINPFAYYSYQAYGATSKEYIEALKARTFANAPELFKDETVTFTFNPSETEPMDGYFILKNGRVSVIALTEQIPQVVTGKVQIINKRITIDLRKK